MTIYPCAPPWSPGNDSFLGRGLSTLLPSMALLTHEEVKCTGEKLISN